jgi:hypothetical protein
MAEASTTPLPTKLGIKPGAALLLVAAPDGFERELAGLPPQVVTQRDRDGRFDVAVCFTTLRAELESHVKRLRPFMDPAAGLWIAWPKRASGLATEINDDVVREVALPIGLVDNKVCAINTTWTGLRLVIRKELR